MKTFTLRAAVAALTLATAAGVASPAMAHGYYHGGYYHGGGWNNSGWWIGGALALGAAGAIIASNARPAVVYTTPVYAAPPVVYGGPVYAAPVYPAPVYTPPPVAYSAPPPPAPSGNMIAYPARGQTQAQQVRDRGECSGWAMNQSGYDPVHPNQWTTGVMVDAYNRAMSACMTGRGYSVS
ncbi:MAG TPA: hypothetical protein VL522_15535 [Bordetella sp.]|nr:hypothetical protein [Bordetella sp.]